MGQKLRPQGGHPGHGHQEDLEFHFTIERILREFGARKARRPGRKCGGHNRQGTDWRPSSGQKTREHNRAWSRAGWFAHEKKGTDWGRGVLTAISEVSWPEFGSDKESGLEPP